MEGSRGCKASRIAVARAPSILCHERRTIQTILGSSPTVVVVLRREHVVKRYADCGILLSQSFKREGVRQVDVGGEVLFQRNQIVHRVFVGVFGLHRLKTCVS